MVWDLRFGRGGWVRVDASDVTGPVYLRYRLERGFVVLCELYLDAHNSEISAKTLSDLNVSDVTRFLQQDGIEGITHHLNEPGPDLSRLASYFNTGFGSQAKHWVADSMRAQHSASGVEQPRMPKFDAPAERREPEPVRKPTGGRLSPEFLRSVAANYLYWASEGKHPAPTIQLQVGPGIPIRTVRSWIKKARDEQYLPPTTQGRVG